jgi:FAD/FMN-containing dehydrogenase
MAIARFIGAQMQQKALSPAALTDALTAIVGPRGISCAPDDLAPWLTDWRGRYTGRAAAMLSPAHVDEVAAIMRLASAHQIAVVPQGGNSGMVGGATPDASGDAILLSLRRMNRIVTIDAANQQVQCEAGVILQHLHEALVDHGQRFPLTLGGKGSATIGGLIATNAGGTQVLRHGTMRALVSGIQAVLPNGEIFDALAPLKKDNRGYDLKHLLIGAEGTLGIVTGAVLRTVPALTGRAVGWAAVPDPEAALALLQHIGERDQSALEGFELMPGICIDSVLRHIDGTRAPLPAATGWQVLIEMVSDRAGQKDPAALLEARLGEAMASGIVSDAVVAQSESQAEAFWKIRDSIAEAERADGPALQHDISVPVAAMPAFLASSAPRIESAFPGTTVMGFGHLGDGNIHYHVKAPAGVDPERWHGESAAAISTMVYDLVAAAGGSISAEHGIGQNKRDHLERLSCPARLFALRAIKAAFDPLNICNPGKLVPLAPGQQAP